MALPSPHHPLALPSRYEAVGCAQARDDFYGGAGATSMCFDTNTVLSEQARLHRLPQTFHDLPNPSAQPFHGLTALRAPCTRQIYGAILTDVLMTEAAAVV